MSTKTKSGPGRVTVALPGLPKPRNPVAVRAKARRAGSHAGDAPARSARRAAKHALQQLLAGRKVADE
jgi:hypothetical protein